MARLQILELPTEHHGDDMITPFVLVIDQADEATLSNLREQASRGDGDPLDYNPISDQVGARAVLVFEETVEIPANNPQTSTSGTKTELRFDGQPWPSSEGVQAAIQEALSQTQRRLVERLRRA
ncbi:hypothetical protein [Streptomyces sp. SGAir0957]